MSNPNMANITVEAEFTNLTHHPLNGDPDQYQVIVNAKMPGGKNFYYVTSKCSELRVAEQDARDKLDVAFKEHTRRCLRDQKWKALQHLWLEKYDQKLIIKDIDDDGDREAYYKYAILDDRGTKLLETKHYCDPDKDDHLYELILPFYAQHEAEAKKYLDLDSQ